MTEIRWSETAGFRALVHDSAITAMYASWDQPRPARLAGEPGMPMLELLGEMRAAGCPSGDGDTDFCV